MSDPRTLSGLDFLRDIIAGKLPPPAMAKTMNVRLSEVENGLAVFRGAPTTAHLNPMGVVHGGWFGAIVDSAMGCAVQSTLAPGQSYTTLEFRVNITRALKPGSDVTCRAEFQHAGRSTAVARAEIRGVADGTLYGTGSTTCMILAVPGL